MKKCLFTYFALCSLLSYSYASQIDPSAGYCDSLGSYSWFTDTNAASFLDSLGVTWYKVTENKILWDEAKTIRSANIKSLLSLGLDSATVYKDVHMYPEKSNLFTKLSYLDNHEKYIAKWKKSFNSETLKRTALKSQRLKCENLNTDLVLKFYFQKSKDPNTNALGLVKKSFIKHSLETSMELIEVIIKKISRNRSPHEDPFYDMHLRNATQIVK